ncbi:hypothetical protein ACFYY1_30320 [Streptomyces sp. NPDC001890]|uniref:hypothetical protein n=1 Tax=Streptomyces sp. NPDC001890 TaxID=3364620 RepID=UPI0036B0DDD3
MTSQILALAVVLVCVLTVAVIASVAAGRARRQVSRLLRDKSELDRRLMQSQQDCSGRDMALEAFAFQGVRAWTDAVTAGGSPTSTEFIVEARLSGSDFAKHLEAAGNAVVSALIEMKNQGAAAARHEARREAQEATAATVRAVAESVQAPCQALIKVIDEGLIRHKDDSSFGTLTRIDHEAQVMSRVAASFAVLSGGNPGRRWTSQPLTAVVRGAMGSIRAHERVRYQELDHRAVNQRAMQPVVHALATLLDNATRYSHPEAPVDVTFESAYEGVTVIVSDAGVRMNEEQQALARKALSGEPVDLHELGPHPKIGFWTVGALAARYGFTAHLDASSAWGGMRQILFLPDTLLNTVKPVAGPRPVAVNSPAGAGQHGTAVGPVAGPRPVAVESPSGPGRHGRHASGLPQRRRNASVSAASGSGAGEAAFRLSDQPGSADVATAWIRSTRRTPSPADSASTSDSEKSE